MKRFMPADGLASRAILALCDDPSAGIWVGTSSGLNLVRPGGIRTFGMDDGLPSRSIMALVIDDKGRLWIGTDGGLAYRDKQGIHHPAPLGDLAGLDIRQLSVGGPGEIVVCTTKRLFSVVGSQIAELEIDPPFHPEDILYCQAACGDSILFIGTASSGLWELDRRSGKRIPIREEPSDSGSVFQVRASSPDDLMFLHNGEIKRKREDVVSSFKFGDGGSRAYAVDFLLSPRGGLLVLGEDELWRMSPDSLWFTYTFDIHGLGMLDFIADWEGALWIGTAAAGLIQIPTTDIENLPKEAVVSAHDFYFISKDSILVATDKNLLLIERAHGTAAEFASGKAMGEFWDIARLGGRTVVGGENGLFELDPDSGLINITTGSPFDERWVTRVLPVGDETAILGTILGLLEYSPGHLREFRGMPETTVYCVEMDGDGVVYAGTVGLGVWRAEGDSVVPCEFNSRLPSGSVNSLLFDAGRGFWIGTDAGLSLLEPNGDLRTWKNTDGLGDEMVTSMALDSKKRLWIGTDRGVQCFDLEGMGFGPLLNAHLGLDGEEITTSTALAVDADDGLWCGFFGGVSRINTKNMGEFVPGPGVRFEKITLDGFSWDSTQTLPYGNHAFTIRYSEKSLLWPKQSRFQYRLGSKDKDWVDAEDAREMIYSHLPRGKYTFMVRARTGFSGWGRPAGIVLNVKAPYWLRAPFVLGALGLLAVLLAGLVKLRTLQLELRSKHLEDIVQARTAQLEEALDKVKELSLTDDLTGLPNRRSLFSQLDWVLGRAARGGVPVVALMIDLDGFKVLNDTYGHDVGDDALRHFAVLLQDGRRNSDLLSRYGGDEFVCILYGSSDNSAGAIAEDLRVRVATSTFTTADGVELCFTVSVGAAKYDPLRHKAGEELVKDADKALYEAKDLGKNRVVLFTSGS